MKPHTCLKLVALVGLVVLLAACDLSVSPPTPAEQIVSPLIQAESPLSSGADGLDGIDSYHVVAHYEQRYTRPDGSLFGGIVESHYYWTRSEGQYGHNEHRVVTMDDLESDTVVVMEESYSVDGLAYTYCPQCPPIDGQASGWSVSKLDEVTVPPGENVAPPPSENSAFSYGQPLMIGVPIAALVPQSVVIGEERFGDITATHYQIIDTQVLSDVVGMRIGLNPSSPLELSMAKVDIWLTQGDQKLIQYTFQVEGRTELIAGTQVLEPFTLLDQYSVTEINSTMPITVPAEVLTAVETQLKALENK